MDNADIHFNIGLQRETQRDLDGAIREYHEAIRIGPDDASAHYNFGNALKMKVDLDGAIREYNEAIRIEPDLKEAQNNLAVDLYETGEYSEAWKHVKIAMELGCDVDPGFIKLLEKASGYNPLKQ